MNAPFDHLASDAGKRRLKFVPSSESSLGLSMEDIVQRGLIGQSESKPKVTTVNAQSLQERVFQALADAKIWTSRVAMHLHPSARSRYFKQLDLLHDCDEWFEGEKPLHLGSYQGFVRFMMSAGGESKPSLALNPHGNLLAVWHSGDDRLTIEFEANGRAHWVVRKLLGNQIERSAGNATLQRLPVVLSPYLAGSWLDLG